MHTDAVAGIVVIYTYRDLIGLVFLYAWFPKPKVAGSNPAGRSRKRAWFNSG